MPTAAAPLERYSPVARWLHWLVAITIVLAFGLALTLEPMHFSPAKLRLINYHKWLGITVLLLAVLRVLWRLLRRPPPLLPAPRWQQFGAHALHGLLYALIFAVPLAGYCFSLADGYPVVYLGIVPLPVFIAHDEALADRLFAVHQALAWALCALVVVHLLAALWHHIVRRDDTLRRMLPGR